MRIVIFTDIDGTLIDLATYSYAETEATVAAIVARQIPLILCSSKTRVEQEYYRQALRLPDPFIVENGSAIFIPQGYFDVSFTRQRLADGYEVIELGVAAATIRQALAAAQRETGLSFQGMGDLTPAEVSEITGLELPAARRAQQRDYSETIVTPLSPDALSQLETFLAEWELAIVSGGKFHTVTSMKSDKGEAVSRLSQLYRRQWGEIVTVGLGDSANDQPLLAAVDRPYLVQKPGGVWQEMDVAGLERVAAVGPAGWRLAAAEWLEGTIL